MNDFKRCMDLGALWNLFSKIYNSDLIKKNLWLTKDKQFNVKQVVQMEEQG